jgi:hypothetical protein
MKKSILVRKNKGRGRPKREDGVDPMISTRFPKQIVEEIEFWARSNELGRSEAIRRLVELGLTVKLSAKPLSRPARSARAAELATTAIDKMIDPSAAPEESAQRRRRLTKGPLEFREDRVDLPKAKGSPK